MNNILLVYSILLIVGGSIGFIKAGSIASLLMSGLFSFLILISISLKSRYPSFSQKFSSSLLSLLSFFFIYRTFATEKLFPSAILALISLAILGWMVLSKKRSNPSAQV